MEVFKSKSPNFEKLVSFGFTYDGGASSFSMAILNNKFELIISATSPSGED